MKNVGANIESFIASLMGDDEQARINYRAHQVRKRYRAAIESVYRENAELFLAHTNNVYILKKDGIKTLIVYVDESIYAAELNAQRELIKLRLLELFGEEIEQFKILVSRGAYKDYHPYVEEELSKLVTPPLPKLSPEDLSLVDEVSAKVTEESVRKSFEKAMTADMARKRAENGTRS